MGHGKETPRQKLIGMMYLVLMAMLALNTSKEVLEGFVIVDVAVMKTTRNFAQKNELLYDEFAQQAIANPAKAEGVNNQVLEIKKRADELVDHIQHLKVEMVRKSEGEGTEALHEDHGQIEIHPAHITGKDNTDLPAEYMIGAADKKGNALRLKLEEFRGYLLENIDEKGTTVQEAVKATLNTDPPPPHDGVQHDWESEHFAHLPLVSVLANLTVMQANVRNAESDMLNYLMAKVTSAPFKFNKLEPTVIPNSNYILKGNMYEAQIFLAAFDTTQNPSVFVGKYDSAKNDEGKWEYIMRPGFDSLPVENGRGYYRKPGNATGFHDWGGIIRIKNSDGTFTTKSFSQAYQIAEANLVVSPTKMNVFYLGVENPVDISVAGVPADRITPEITNGSITSRPPYIVKPKRPGNCMLTVYANIDGNRRNMGSKEFRVKTVPNPVATVNGRNGGAIAKNLLLAVSGVAAEMESFDFELKYIVTEFTISTTVQGFQRFSKSNSNRITQEQRNLLQNLDRGQNVYFEDIKAIGPDGVPRDLQTIKFKIN